MLEGRRPTPRAPPRWGGGEGRGEQGVDCRNQGGRAARPPWRPNRHKRSGELIEDLDGALWPRDLIERCRREAGGPFQRDCFPRLVVGVDPPAGENGDPCGIVVAGLGRDGIGHVLADCSAAGLPPNQWAARVAGTVEAWQADRVVAEVNNGGAMVTAVLRGAGLALPVREVHASIGKSARAEPVAALFESGRAVLAGRFPELEDELAGLTLCGGYDGPGRSPDRADAMVWALTELLLGKPARVPRITFL